MLMVSLLMCLHGAAQAQECLIGVYADPEGTLLCLDPPGSGFSLYVVMSVENTVAAAAYSLTYGPGMFVQARFSGPSGTGLVIDEPTGTNVALGECVIGFGGAPVLIDEYQFAMFSGQSGEWVDVGPNTSQNPDYPVYVTCNDLTTECAFDEPLLVSWFCTVPADSRSFGSVKSLFYD